MTRVLVLGAGQGIGQATVETLAGPTLEVHLAGRRRDTLDPVAEQARRTGATALVHDVDVTDPAAVERLGADIGDTLDTLVYSVGESSMAPLAETSQAHWDRVLDVNLTGAYRAVHHLLPALRRSTNGSVVLVASKVALGAYPVAVYSAAKTGMLGLARGLGAELAADMVRVVAVCPGPTDTPMRWSATPDIDPSWVVDAASIASAIRFVTGLPRGTTVEPLAVQAIGYE